MNTAAQTPQPRTYDQLGACQSHRPPCPGCTGTWAHAWNRPDLFDINATPMHTTNTDGTCPHDATQHNTPPAADPDAWAWIDELMTGTVKVLTIVIGGAIGIGLAGALLARIG